MDEWYSIGGFNDPFSSLSHLVGTVIFFVFSIVLLVSAWRSRPVFLYCLQFAVATLFLLSMSFVFHMMAVGGTARDVMLRLDVAAIFVMIASTFTVIHGILFSGWRFWGFIGPLWVITITGVTLRTIFFHSIPAILGDGIFLLMGWIGAASARVLFKEYGWSAVRPVLVGGAFYTLGAIINAIGWPVFIYKVWGAHETFHLFVLAGLGTHWAFVWSLADGTFQRRARENLKDESSGNTTRPTSSSIIPAKDRKR